VQGVVFADLDGDGSFSPFTGDTALAGWTVQLMWNGQVIATTLTGTNGQYLIDGLASFTTYEVCASAQAGFVQGPPMAGTTYDGCGGSGYSFSANTSFQTVTPRNFSMIPQ